MRHVCDRHNEVIALDEAVAFRFRRRVGLIFQNPDVQLFNPTVFDEVAFGPLQLRWPKDHIRRRVMAIFDLTGLTPLQDRPPRIGCRAAKENGSLSSPCSSWSRMSCCWTNQRQPLLPQSQMINLLVSWRGGAKTVVTATHDLDIVEDRSSAAATSAIKALSAIA